MEGLGNSVAQFMNSAISKAKENTTAATSGGRGFGRTSGRAGRGPNRNKQQGTPGLVPVQTAVKDYFQDKGKSKKKFGTSIQVTDDGFTEVLYHKANTKSKPVVDDMRPLIGIRRLYRLSESNAASVHPAELKTFLG